MTSVFSVMDSVTPVCFLRSNRILLALVKYITRCHRFHYRTDILPLIPAFYLLQLHSVILVLYQHHIRLATLHCDSRTEPIFNNNPEEPFLEIDVKGGEREITSKLKLNHFYRGRKREYSGGESFSTRRK